MTDPSEIISALFTLAVGVVVLAVLFTSQTGGNVVAITNIVSSLAVPFVIILIGIFVLLEFAQLN